jgi:hypothetical protein
VAALQSAMIESFCCAKTKGFPLFDHEKFAFFAKKFCRNKDLHTFVRLSHTPKGQNDNHQPRKSAAHNKFLPVGFLTANAFARRRDS